MTELQLYKWINDNEVEVHIYRKGQEMDDCSELSDENYDEWKILMFPFFSQLESLCQIIGQSYFDDEGVEVIMKYGYVAIDLKEMMEYSGIEPSNIFPKKL